MPSTDILFEEIIECVATQYTLCVEKARELFTDEQAIQSASATMFINATKEKSSVGTYINSLKERIAKTNPEAIPSAIKVWEWHFSDFIKEFGGRIKGLLIHYVEQNLPEEQIERNIRERYYHLKCETLEDEDARKELEIKLFGE